MKIRGGALWVVSILFITLSQAPASHAMQREKSDLWIKTALESDMEKDGHLDLNRIGVSSHHGIVKLDGTVLTGEEKGLAELIAMQIPGVRGVENDILVIPPLDPDIAIEKQARAALIENPLLDIRQLRVHVVNRIVTLQGIVLRTRERHIADRLVSMLPDVDNVVDKLEALPKA
jgi:osmotically-inducible protein OsmY